jgi:formyl-CoA transferase/CoA:oxalate CoA-transferase
MTRTEILDKMAAAEIPAGPINTVAEILENPQIHAREMVRELTHPAYGPIRVLGLPIKLSDTPGAVEGPPPYFGEHNAAVLTTLGYSSENIEAFKREGALAASRAGGTQGGGD